MMISDDSIKNVIKAELRWAWKIYVFGAFFATKQTYYIRHATLDTTCDEAMRHLAPAAVKIRGT